MKKYITMLAAAVMILSGSASRNLSDIPEAAPGRIAHVEPPSWWTGMKCPLQLMVNGEDISAYDVSVQGGRGVKVAGVHKADSPNYLFVDISVSPKAKAGTYWLVFDNGRESFRYPYEIASRKEGSAGRASFTTADLVYLIMPDRFANGDPSNDDTPDTAEKADRESAGGRHGGDIQGIIDHLDYIADLGATAIWCTPLLLDDDRFGSYHGYACSDYYKIDPRFGSNELYREFVDRAHDHGLKVIMDIVTNHSGTRTHWWADDLPFNDWIHQFPEYTGSNGSFSTVMDPNASVRDAMIMDSGWFTGGMADMNLDNPYLLQYFKQWAIWWIEWSGLDGFRVDTYPYNEKVPMSEWCKAVTDEYPNFNIVGECWTGSIPQLAYWQKDNPNKDGFNSNLPSIMDFPLRDAATAVFSAREAGIRSLYDVFSHDFCYQDLDNMLIFPGNHDTERAGDIAGKNPERFKAMMTLFATARGIPQILYGDEMMFISSDLRQGHGGLRVDFPGGWEGDEFDLFTKEGRLAADTDFDGSEMDAGVREDVYDYCRTLFRWRKDADVIHHGRTLHFLPEGSGYGYFRYDDNEAVFVFINNSSEDEVAVPWSHYSEFTEGLHDGINVITGEKATVSDDTVVPPLGALVIEFKR